MAYNDILYQGCSCSLKSSGEFIGLPQQLKCMREFKKTIREKGLRTALEERERPFGGIVGRYPPVEE